MKPGVNTANFILGDRALPMLAVQPHLRVVDDRRLPLRAGYECPLYSRVDGRYPVFSEFMPVRDALAVLVAGEA